VAAVIVAGMVWGVSQYVFFNQPPPALPAADPIVELGSALVDPQLFLVPFEAVSVLLLSALIGAVLVAGGAISKKKPE
jgi:NADH:ubiquinone oxidoreductase subunit 6 (subunit J)